MGRACIIVESQSGPFGFFYVFQMPLINLYNF